MHPRVARALSYYQRAQRVPGRAAGTVTAPAARTGSRIAAGLARRTGVDGDLVRETLGSTATVGRQWWTTQRAQRFGFDRLNGLSETARGQVSRLLRRSDEDIDDDLRAMSDDDIEAASRVACRGVLASGAQIQSVPNRDGCDPDVFEGFAALSDDLPNNVYSEFTEFRDGFTRRVAHAYEQHNELDAEDIEGLTNTFSELNSDNHRRFVETLEETDADLSLMKTASSPNIGPSAIDTAFDRVESNLDKESITEFRTATETNYQEFEPGYEDPYTPGSIVVEFNTRQQRQFVRVHGEDNQARSWMMNEESIRGLSAEEIQSKYSLPQTPVYVSDVIVPEGTRVRMGDVNANFGGEQGATQFELGERISEDQFINRRELDADADPNVEKEIVHVTRRNLTENKLLWN